MGYFVDTARALAVTMRNVFRPPTTVQYPAEDRVRPERYRTSFALVHDEDGDEACIACLACERICPSRIITVKPAGKRESPITGKKRNYLEDLTLDMNACIFCELCVQVCPTDALIMLRELTKPSFSREGLFLSMERLYANESVAHSWGTGTRLMEMQNPKRDLPPPEPKPEAPPQGAGSTEGANSTEFAGSADGVDSTQGAEPTADGSS